MVTRRLLAVGVLLPVLAGPGAASSQAATPVYGASTGYQINAQHTGVASGSPLPKVLKRRWVSRNLGIILSYPVVANNRVFVTAAAERSKATAIAYGYDLKTGRQLWRRSLGPSSYWNTAGGLAYGGGRLYVAGTRGALAALNPATGGLLWKTDLEPDGRHYGNGPVELSNPLVAANGVVYANDAYNGYLYALNWTTGAVRWHQLTGSSTPTVSPDGIWTTNNNIITRLGLDGHVIWSQRKAGSNSSIRSDVLAASGLWSWASGFVTDPITGVDGTFRWSSFDTPVVGPDFAVVTDNDIEYASTLRAIDPTTGTQRWTARPDPTVAGVLIANPVATSSTVYMRTELGTVHGYDLHSGRHVWQGTTGIRLGDDGHHGTSTPAMAIGSGALVVPSEHQLVVFR